MKQLVCLATLIQSLSGTPTHLQPQSNGLNGFFIFGIIFFLTFPLFVLKVIDYFYPAVQRPAGEKVPTFEFKRKTK